MVLEIVCISCGENWDLDHEPTRCVCNDPVDGSWLLYVDGEFSGENYDVG